MSMTGCKYFAALLLLFTCSLLHAQVSVRVSASRDSILIGEPVQLTVQAYTPLGQSVTWFAADTIPHFAFISKGRLDTAENMDGKKLSQSFTITSFDSGRLQIPPFEVIVAGQSYYSDSIAVNVYFAPFNPKDDYRDIKDIVITEDPFARYIPWIIAAVALVAAALIGWLVRRRPFGTAAVAPAAPEWSALEEARRALAQLETQASQAGEEKWYYSTMNDILRNYLRRRFSLATFERTNEELILQVASLNIPRNNFNSLAQSLRMSDFVKFAKYRPSVEDNKHNLDIFRTSIEVLDQNNAA